VLHCFVEGTGGAGGQCQLRGGGPMPSSARERESEKSENERKGLCCPIR